MADEDIAPYSRPPLSKDFLRGETEADALPLESDDRYAELRIDIELGCVVRSVDPALRRATVDDGRTFEYRSCVLATGSAPQPLPVPGAESPSVAYLRSLNSARGLRAAAEQASSITVIGSGFIGCEAAVSLAAIGRSVTVISTEDLPQQARLGPDVGREIAGWLAAGGVRLLGGRTVTGIEDGRIVHVEGERPVPADLVLVAAGSRPRIALVADSGVAIEGGRVVVDERMRTDAPGLLAAGDIAFARNVTAGRHLAVEHWGEALAMGVIAGATAAGGTARWDQAPGFWSGIGEHTLKYVAWGDGYDEVQLVQHGGGAFTAWYTLGGVVVGVATHDGDGEACERADEDYERGRELVEKAQPLPLRIR